MIERNVCLEIEEAYEVKALSLKRAYRILGEEAPALISVAQGALWGISPRTAEKVMNYCLASVNSDTQITCSSSLASD